MTLSEEIDISDFIDRMKLITNEDIDKFVYVGVSDTTLLRKSVEKVIVEMGYSSSDNKDNVFLWLVVTNIETSFCNEFHARCKMISKSSSPDI